MKNHDQFNHFDPVYFSWWDALRAGAAAAYRAP